MNDTPLAVHSNWDVPLVSLEDEQHFETLNGLWKGKKEPLIEAGVIRNTNFTSAGVIDYSKVAWLDVEQSKLVKRQLQFGDIILERSGGGPKQPVGRVVYFGRQDGVFSFSNFTSAIRVRHHDKFLPKFVFYALMQLYQSGGTEDLQRRTTGIRNLDFAAYKRRACVPELPLEEQKKIAHVLSMVQRAIESQERIIQTTTELKKALMHKLFTEGLHNGRQKQTEIGPVPESWDVVELGKFLQIKHGFAFNGKLFRPSGKFVLMTPGNFNEEGGFRDQGEKTKYFVGDFPREYLLHKDDLLVAMTEQKSGLLGSAAFVPQSEMYLHNQRLGLIVELDERRLSKRFLFHLFNTPHLRIEVAKTATGSKVKHTSPGRLRSVKVAIPPTLDEQEEIAFALNVTERRSETARRNASNLRVLFGCLLNNLISGHISARDIKPRHEATAGRACN